MPIPGVRVRWAPDFAPGDGEPTSWHDISDRVQKVSTRFGRSADLDRVEAATATVQLENDDGLFTPENTDSDYEELEPFAPVEISWVGTGGETPFILGSAALGTPLATLYDVPPSSAKVFRGLVQRFIPKWNKRLGGMMTLSCVDLFRYLQFSSFSGTYPEQTVGQRISAILADIGNPFLTDIDLSGVTLEADTLSGKALDYMRTIAALDGGLFYDRGGRIAFRSRVTLIAADEFLNSQATLGDGAGEFNYQDIQLGFDEQAIVNYITGSLADGTPMTAQQDAESIARYLKRDKDYGTTALTSMSELRARAAWDLALFRRPRWRIDNLEYQLRDPNLDATALIDLDLMHRVTLIRRPSSGSAITVPCLVDGFEHDVTPKSWLMRIRLRSAPTGWTLGSSGLGVGTLL